MEPMRIDPTRAKIDGLTIDMRYLAGQLASMSSRQQAIFFDQFFTDLEARCKENGSHTGMQFSYICDESDFTEQARGELLNWAGYATEDT
jgi:hypothetical protein